MQHERNQPLTPEGAREVCLRTNNKAFVSGAISNAASRYLLTLNAEDCAKGNSLAGVETEAADRDQLPQALRRAAAQLAEKLALSLPALPEPKPRLPDDITGALEAVQAYAQAGKLDSSEAML